jgi:uncharacterized membrane protein YhaH (DUF805 family)
LFDISEALWWFDVLTENGGLLMEWMILPLKRYADFSGRARRKEFWMFQLLNFLVALALLVPVVISVISADLAVDPDNVTFGSVGTVGLVVITVYMFYALAVLIPSIAVTVRRFHDRDMSGWWYLGFILGGAIPVVGFVITIGLIVVLALPGTPGSNRFGADPKNPFDEGVFA